jgi:outer membrane lipoprotein-sorting protein
MANHTLNLVAATALVALTAIGVQPASAALPALSADKIVEKNVAARGGLSAWRSVRSISWKGKMGAGASTYTSVIKGKIRTKERPEAVLPFVLEFKRPYRSRLEIEFDGQTAVQVYDGTSGWKLRPYLGRKDAEPFTPAELKQVAGEPGIDGFLIDYAAKGSKIELAGTGKVENRDCYELKVTTKSGQTHHVWVDGETFLDAKIQGDPRVLDGRPRQVSIYPRDFKTDGGLKIPHVIETVVEGGAKPEKITIESVAINAKIDDSRFAKPKI